MRLLTLTLLAYGCGLLVLRGPIGASVNLTGGFIWLDLMVAILLSAACGLILLRRSESGPSVSYATIGATTLAIGMTIFGVMQIAANSQSSPIAALATVTGAEAKLDRAWDGHFRALAQIDGTDVGLMVDTGASIVLLRFDDAIRIGINPANLDFSIPLTTAGGRSYIAPFLFETIQIGDVIVHNVEGGVAQKNTLHSSLLGMSYLEQLDETVIRSDEMIFRQ